VIHRLLDDARLGLVVEDAFERLDGVLEEQVRILQAND